MIGFSMKDH